MRYLSIMGFKMKFILDVVLNRLIISGRFFFVIRLESRVFEMERVCLKIFVRG